MELTPNNNQNKTNERQKNQNEFEFQTSTQTLQAPFLNLIINSQNIQDEVIKPYIFQYYSQKLKELQKISQIKDESITTFFQFLNGEDFELKKEEFIDLFKITDIFKANLLEKILIQFLRDNSNNVDFIMSLKIEQEKDYSPNLFQNDQFSIVIEECISNNINQCLQNEQIKNIKIASIYRMIEKNHTNLSADILYHFICESIEERQSLLYFLDLEKMSPETFEEIYIKYTNDIRLGECSYYDYLPNNIIFIKRLKDEKARCDELIRSQEQENRNLQQTIITKQKELKKTIKSNGKKQKELELRNKTLINENEQLKQQIKELLKRDEIYLEDKIIEKNKNITIINSQIERPMPSKGKFMFFATGSPNLLLKGIEVELQMTYNLEQCKSYLKSILQRNLNYNIDSYDLLIYLAGGIPFINGKLSEFYLNNGKINFRPYIYGVLIQHVSEVELYKKYQQLCDIKLNRLLSPNCTSTLKGICDIACILGYLSCDGLLCEKFLNSCATVINFPPFITCLNRIIERNDITGRDIITVTSTLHTYFSYLLDPCPSSDKVFEYSLKCCNYIMNIKNENENIPMRFIDINNDIDDRIKFLTKLIQLNTVYLWNCDCDNEIEFISYELKPFNPDIWNENDFLSLGPIFPLSIKYACGCSIIKGKNHNFFYLSHSTQEKNSNMIDLIDPTEGMIKSVDLEEFASLQKNTMIQDSVNFINTNQIKQVIFVCLDCSKLMNYSINGTINHEIETRAIIALQYLDCFVSKVQGYRIPCICGLIKFNSEINEVYSISHLDSEFSFKNLEIEQQTDQAHLWDAIYYGCDRLNKFTKRPNGDSIFKNAINRIIVISAGEDNGSNMNLEKISKEVIESKVIVDSILLNTNEKCKELATLCHITGGLAFNPKTINEGLVLFEKTAFLNVNERIQSNIQLIQGDRKTRQKFIKVNQINSGFIQKAIKDTNFDTNIGNKFILRVTTESRLATPRHICSSIRKNRIQQPRKRRILSELHYSALISDSNSDNFDPNIAVFPFNSCFDIWHVFLKGEEFTPYEGKWFNIIVIFPELYPTEAPMFKFISIPYHLNISSDGHICMDILNKHYSPSLHVIDIIQQLKELFILPNIMNSVQIDILETFIDDKERYNNIARESTQKVGKDDYKSFFPSKVMINDIVDDEFKLIFNENEAPLYMSSHISDRVIRNPVFVNTGVYYEREELRQLLDQNRAIEYYGRQLTDEDFDPI